MQSASVLVLIGKLADILISGAPGSANIQMFSYFTLIFFQGLAIGGYFVMQAKITPPHLQQVSLQVGNSLAMFLGQIVPFLTSFGSPVPDIIIVCWFLVAVVLFSSYKRFLPVPRLEQVDLSPTKFLDNT